MSTRTLNNVVNDQTVTLNALIYGYAGHSLVTPHAAIQQIWWTDERINEKVTAEFVASRLRPNERHQLDQPVGFGDLTDDTYMDWILERARRLYLVLVEVGEADKIFKVVEKAWDDDDLPLQMEDIEKLSLSNRRNDQVNIRFFHTQFTFLLRELDERKHIDYAPNEVLPLEYVMGLPPAVTLQHWSRVHRPKKPNEVYVRRKFPLGTAEYPDAFAQDFIMDLESAKLIEHEHIAPLWASYTAKGNGYILTDFVGQHTLKSFIDHRNPAQYQRLPKPDRRYLVLGWLHCLADAVATLHQMGFCHSSIRPSNILIDDQNNIAFSDIGSLETFQKDKKPDPMEMYNYGPPECHTSEENMKAEDAAPVPFMGHVRKSSITSKISEAASNSSGPQRQKLTKMPTNELSGFNFGFRRSQPAGALRPRSRARDTEQADVFSLGCIYLDIMTFLVKKKSQEFVKHRSSKQKTNTGGKNSRTDSSFHANLERLDSWIKRVEGEAFEKEDDAFRAVPPIMSLIRGMLSRAPDIRPSAREVRDRLLDILLQYTSTPNVHCWAHSHDAGVAASLKSTSDVASSNSSVRSSWLSISTMSSDADTIRSSRYTPRVSSILNSYTDRNASLSGLSESDMSSEVSESEISSVMSESDMSDFDDGASVCTARRSASPPIANWQGSGRTTPTSASSPRVPQEYSPSRVTMDYNIKPWNKPFLLIP